MQPRIFNALSAISSSSGHGRDQWSPGLPFPVTAASTVVLESGQAPLFQTSLSRGQRNLHSHSIPVPDSCSIPLITCPLCPLNTLAECPLQEPQSQGRELP